MNNIAYHFTGSTLRDGSAIPPIGHTLRMDGDPVMCERGFHWSLRPSEALRYAPGPLLHRVRYSGKFLLGNDKGVSTERTILAAFDATYLMRRFAADQALSVAHLWDMPVIVREYLTDLDKEKRVAARAAAGAAGAAARVAGAWIAARIAVRAERAAALDVLEAAGAALVADKWEVVWSEFDRRAYAEFDKVKEN